MTFSLLSDDEKVKIDVLFKKFKPKKNVTVERYKFNTRCQGASESVEQYVTALRLVARNCDYKDLEDELGRDRIVCGTNSERIKERLLREQDLTLDKALHTCRADEESKKQLKSMDDDMADTVVHSLKSRSRNVKGPRPSIESEQWIFSCRFCGSQHAKGKRPAFGKKYTQCNRLNHFAKVCRDRKKVAVLLEDQEQFENGDQQFVGGINKSEKNVTNEYCVTLDVEGVPIRLKVDTGAQANILYRGATTRHYRTDLYTETNIGQTN